MRLLRGLVSTNKRRFKDGRHNLDLSYVLDGRLLALGYPSEGLRSVVRNPLDEVRSCLRSQHHLSDVCVFNLCIEQGWQYDPATLGTEVVHLPMWDGQAPPLAVINEFCQRASAWLVSSPKRCVAVHCKAGKGRTGTLIVALLLYLVKHTPELFAELTAYVTNPSHTHTHTTSHTPATDSQPSDALCEAERALDWWTKKRFHDHKGLTICSQRSQRRWLVDHSSMCTESAVGEHACASLCMADTGEENDEYVSYYASLLHTGLSDAPSVTVELISVRVTGLTRSRDRPSNTWDCLTPHDVNTVTHTDSDPQAGSWWDVPALTLAVWLRPPRHHTPHLLQYATCAAGTRRGVGAPTLNTAHTTTRTTNAGMVAKGSSEQQGDETRVATGMLSEGLDRSNASTDRARHTQLAVLADGSLLLQVTHVQTPGRSHVSQASLASTTSQALAVSAQAAQASNTETGATIVQQSGDVLGVTGDIKLQLFSSVCKPRNAAQMGGNSLFGCWVNTAFLDTHGVHTRLGAWSKKHAGRGTRPHNPAAATTQPTVPVPDTNAGSTRPHNPAVADVLSPSLHAPETSAGSTEEPGAAHSGHNTVRAERTVHGSPVKRVVLGRYELDKVSKSLQGSEYEGLSVELCYRHIV